MAVYHISTASVNLHLRYRCSKCGEVNHLTEKLSASASNRYTREHEAQAVDDLRINLQHLTSWKAASRYLGAGLSCKCQKCKHREPWARMQYKSTVSIGIMLLGAYTMVSSAFLFDYSNALGVTALILGAIILGLSFLWVPLHKKVMSKQITRLDVSALPWIAMEQNGRLIPIIPPAALEDDQWVCCECGEINDKHRSRCRFCNMNRNWSLAQKEENRPSDIRVFDPRVEEANPVLPKTQNCSWVPSAAAAVPNPSSGTPTAPAEEYLDDITFIGGMKHTFFDPWHQYDVLLAARGYGWDMMKDWADYMAEADLEHIDQVTVSTLGTLEKNIIESYFKNGGKCRNTPELDMEMGTLSIAGFSKTINGPVKIVWVNQTRTLRLFTLGDDELLMRKYVETMARRTFGTENAMKLGKPIPPKQ